MESLSSLMSGLNHSRKVKMADEIAHFFSTSDLTYEESQQLVGICEKYCPNYQNIYDFNNVNDVDTTYSGAKRAVIGVLQEDLDLYSYGNDSELTSNEIDIKLLDNPNFESYKYSRKQLNEYVLRKCFSFYLSDFYLNL